MTSFRARGVPDEYGRLLFTELRRLHQRAGEPSSRAIARALGAGILSHTTVNAVLSGQRVPRWGPLELVVRHLGGDVERFRELWIKARKTDGSASRSVIPTVGEPPTLVGRRSELDTARGWLVDLAAGHGRAVLVEGEPGVGKSALTRVVAAEAAAVTCRVVRATCDELSQAFPLLPLLDALETPGRAMTHGRPKISDLLRAGYILGDRADAVTAAVERLLALVEELCTIAPVMLIVDDLQWADSATVTAFGRLARSVHRLPLLLVGVTRPGPRRDDLSALRRAVPASWLVLRGLSDPEVAELVARRTGGIPGESLLELATSAAGNPLYVIELVDALVRSQGLAIDERVEVVGEQLPDSLSAAVAHRMEFMSTPAREVLRIAALLGRGFSVSELAVVSGRRVADLLPVLDEAAAAGVLLDDGPELVFRHPLLRACLYEGTPAALRAAWHRDAARALAEDGASAERVARQLLPILDLPGAADQADQWTVRWLAEMGHQLTGQAPHAAIRLLRWALAAAAEGATRDRLTCRLADALYRVGEFADAARVAAAALPYARSPDVLVDLHWTLTQCRAIQGRSEECLVALEQALAAPGLGPAHRARLLLLVARTQRNLGRTGPAGQVAAEALAAATAAGDRWATGWALLIMAIVHGMQGSTAEALQLFDRALAAAEGDAALADLRLLLQLNKAVTLGEMDRYEEAVAVAGQARRMAGSSGNLVRLAQAQSTLGELLFDLGRWDDALAEVNPAATEGKSPTVACTDYGIAAAIRLHRGEQEARQHLVDAVPYAARVGDRIVGPLALARSLEREQAEAPAEALAVLLDGLSEMADRSDASGLLADATRLAVTVGDRSAAYAVVSRAEAVAAASDVPHCRAVGPHCRGLLDNDPQPLLQAADHYRVAKRLLPRAQALEAAGAALASRSAMAGAQDCLTEAFSLYRKMNATWDLARVESVLTGYGMRPDLS
ncbi:MAG TPA: AAA family ATPase [Micromonosporaceae bacterium]|nr:AAA family ATPase [Micromonosporaceae bacterium]